MSTACDEELQEIELALAAAEAVAAEEWFVGLGMDRLAEKFMLLGDLLDAASGSASRA